MEDLITLAGLYTVTVRAGTNATGTSREWLYCDATVTAENDLTKLTGRGYASGRIDDLISLREEALQAALADAAMQAQALAKAKGYKA